MIIIETPKEQLYREEVVEKLYEIIRQSEEGEVGLWMVCEELEKINKEAKSKLDILIK